jgi:hypothetical protein
MSTNQTVEGNILLVLAKGGHGSLYALSVNVFVPLATQ